MSMQELMEKAREDLREAESEAAKRRKALDEAVEEARTKGIDIVNDESEYKAFKEKYGDPLQEAANRRTSAQEKFAEFASLLAATGGAPDPEGNGPGSKNGEPETKGRPVRTAGDLLVKRLVESPAWKAIAGEIELKKDQGHLNLRPVELMSADESIGFLGRAFWERKAAGDNLITGGTATSAGAAVLNDFLPGAVDLVPYAPNRLLDLIPKATTDSDTIDYLTEDGLTNNAAETAEATSGSDGALSESAMTWARVQDSVQLIGHYVPATTRALEDYGQLRSVVERKLVGGLFNRLDNQVYDGNGTSPNISGITDRSGYQTQALGSDSRSDQVLKAVLAIRTTASVNDNLNPAAMAVVYTPTDWTDLRLEKNANGDYVYGPPSGPVGFSIWGMPVVQDANMSNGTGLVGDFSQCELFVRRGVTISSTDSHDDWFISEIIAIKATLRAALAVYKPAAFVGLTGI